MPQHYDLVGEKYILKESVTLSKNYSPTHVSNFGNFQQKKGEGGGSTTGMEGPSSKSLDSDENSSFTKKYFRVVLLIFPIVLQHVIIL